MLVLAYALQKLHVHACVSLKVLACDVLSSCISKCNPSATLLVAGDLFLHTPLNIMHVAAAESYTPESAEAPAPMAMEMETEAV